MIIFVTNVCYSTKVFEFFEEKIFSWQKFTCFVKSKKEKEKKGKNCFEAYVLKLIRGH
jgi:hypothetical protein